MRRKVASHNLETGMYVVELDRPWIRAPFEPPFEVQGFALRSDDEIEKICDVCQFVYIDPHRGKPAAEYLPEEARLEHVSELFTSFSRESIPTQVYEDTTSLEQEMPMARQILEDTNQVYTQIVNDLGNNREPSVKDVQTVVNNLLESVVRNPEALSWLVQLKHQDETTYVQAISVAVLAITVGRFLGLPKDRLEVLGTATLLQDVGKMSLPEDLLSKTDRLTAEDWKILRDHVITSEDMLAKSRNFNIEVISIVRMHHERFNGSGYPQKLAGNDIPLLATISGLVDCYQAGTSDRPYRPAKTSFQVLMELYAGRDSAFPRGIVEQFIQCVGIFPIGSFVEFNTGEVGIVIHRNRVEQLKPQVMILIDSNGRHIDHPATIDLAAQYLEPEQKPRQIAKVVDPTDFDLDPDEFFA